ncbi:MAG: hypothetical protein NZV14_09305 [Bryobacteraceae bacterium]|nr:hypothetical protein [Bryobacteraceae bacterium]MDW8378348.1 hypothetical protein [Bryobacterales bacterium]
MKRGASFSDLYSQASTPFGTNFNPAANDPTTNRPLPPNFLRDFVGWGDINLREPASSSNYHSLQVSLNRRFANQLQYGLSYTWSKSHDYNSDDGNTVSRLVPVRVWNYGLSTFDVTHVLKVNWLYDLPRLSRGPAMLRAVLNDWQFSGIYSAASGLPLGLGFTTVTPVDITGSPTDGARVVLTGNPVLPRGERNFYRWFNTSTTALPAVGTIGNAARTNIRGPGINNFDLVGLKNIRITERFRAQLRGEFYNAFNHTQYSAVDTTSRFDGQGRQVNSQLGQITATRPGRRIQLAFRILF